MNTSSIAVVPGNLSYIYFSPLNIYPASINITAGTTYASFRAVGFDNLGNVNTTWSPTWGTTDGLGIVTPAGGDPLKGYLVNYTSTGSVGYDNVTVQDSASGLVANRSCVRVDPDILDHINITPYYKFPASLNIQVGRTTPDFVAFGYDRFNNLNTTWSPSWGTTSGLGSIISIGGDAVSGYNASYKAGTTQVGHDNITVTDTSTSVSNQSCIRVLPGGPYLLVKVSGDLQAGTVNSPLSNPFVVQVRDQYGNVLAGEDIYFNVTTTGLNGDGAFSPSGNSSIVVVSDFNGTSRALLELDSMVGTNTATAEFAPTSLGRVTFNSTGLADSLARLYIDPVQVNLTVNATQKFNLTGTDQYGNSVPLSGTFWKTNAGMFITNSSNQATLRASKTPGAGLFVGGSVGGLFANATVNILPDVLDKIMVTPAQIDIIVAGQQEFAAAGYDRFGNQLGLVGTVWATDSGLIVTSNNTHANFQAQGNPKTGGEVTATVAPVTGKAVVNVIKESSPPSINGRVPNVNLLEDGPPFTLALALYEYDSEDMGIDLDWYITGEDASLYTVAGEYSDDDNIILTPLPDVYGNDLVTLWLVDSDNLTDSQPLWINVTPVNDPPVFSEPPDLVVRYDDPYTFDYGPYIRDKESFRYRTGSTIHSRPSRSR
jgi:hypothetical protein